MMDAVEAKVQCLEMAIRLAIPGTRDVDAVVKIASSLYDFVKSPDVKSGEADKPKAGRPPKPRAE